MTCISCGPETLLSEAMVVYNMLDTGRSCQLALLADYQQVLKCQLTVTHAELMPCCAGSEIRQCLVSPAGQAACLPLYHKADVVPFGNQQCQHLSNISVGHGSVLSTWLRPRLARLLCKQTAWWADNMIAYRRVQYYREPSSVPELFT